MKFRSIHIIAGLLLALFASHEIAADLSLWQAHQQTSTNGDPGSPQDNPEERSAEQEQKILAAPVQVPLPACTLQRHPGVYPVRYIPNIALGILTPPPKSQV